MKSQLAAPETAVQIPWQNILTSLEDGVLVLDLNGQLIFLNQAAETLTQLSSSQALRRSALQLFRRNPWIVDMIETYLPSKRGSTRAEGEIVTYRGRRVPEGVPLFPRL